MASFKANQETIDKIINFYSYCKKESNNSLLTFFASCDDFSLSIYKSGTVLFQGKNAEKEIELWHKETKEVLDHMGSDEVGCGDYFGPIVVAASLVTTDKYDDILALGVRDSKQLTDEKILEIAPKIIKLVPTCAFTLSNAKYNEIRDKDYNLNKIKAYLHNFVLYNLVNKTGFKGKIIMDQFAEERLYYSYLRDYNVSKIQRNIYFTTKAENKYLAVACGSIVARYTFLNEIKKMEEKIGKKIPLGAGKEVDEFAYKLAKKIGLEKMNEFVKLHFKNTNTLKERLNG